MKPRRRVHFLNIGKKTVYYDEIILPSIFKHLYLKETPILNFNAKVILGSRPFITFLSKDRKDLFWKGEILIIRLSKGRKEAQFISKIYRWGKVHVPIKFIKLLKIKNHERIKVEVIGKNKGVIPISENIDLSQIEKDILPRENNFITIYSKQKVSITLPKIIRITPELLELVYLIHGDGHYQYKLYFINKSPELHEFTLNQFENIFKIPKNLWKARVLISNLEHAEHAKDYWKKRLNLDESQFYNISKSTLNTDNRGNLRIIFDNTILSVIFKFVFYHLKALDYENSLHALNGLLYAEGGAQINDVSLHRITISFNEKERDMFKKILETLKLGYTIQQDKNFIIQGWANQYNFFNIFLSNDVIPFRIHKQRKSRAITGFLNHSFTKTMKKYLSILKEGGPLYTQEFSKSLGIRSDSLLDTLRKRQYNGFVNLKKTINSYEISITQEGIEFLNIISKMQDIKEDNLVMGRLPFETIKREVIIKKEAETNPELGCRPEERSTDQLIRYGVVNLNKPHGPTSHQVVDYVKKMLDVKRAGHSGTLE